MAEVAKVNTINVTHRKVATGTYTGDNTEDRQITNGFKCSLVYLSTEYKGWLITPDVAQEISDSATISTLTGGTSLHATDGFIVYKTGDVTNQGAILHYYWAISE